MLMLASHVFRNVLRWALGFLLLFFAFHTILRLVRRYQKFPIPSILTELIDNPVRRRYIQSPNVLANRMSLEPGMVVVEIGPGKGSYTKAVAERILPGGILFAIDIQESVIERLIARVNREGITNISPRVDDAYDLSFDDESVDRVFAIACLPEIPEPVRALREFHRVLKPDGLLCLSELFMDADYPRRSMEKRWAEETGFALKEEFGSFFAYQLNFEKKTP
jgi:ubiquinone/menaquinone biosynthesis C-methylase UbiE